MTKTLTIKPVDGRLLPLEHSPRRHVTAQIDVQNTSYYRRAIKRGDVDEVTKSSKSGAPSTPSAPKGNK